jgi:hypothetical protein
MSKKPWKSVEWRKKREEFLRGKSCVWCGSVEQLVIHHNKTFHGFREYKRIGKNLLAKHFKNGKNKRELRQLLSQTEKQVTRKFCNACPQCGYSLQERKIKKPKYRCYRCIITLDNPIKKETPSSKKRFDTVFSKLFFNNHKQQIQHIFARVKEKSDQEYFAFTNTIILCKRCHHAHHKKMRLCRVCKTHYHKARYRMCWSCFRGTSGG